MDLDVGSPLYNAFQDLIRRNITGLFEFDLAQSCSGASLSSQMYGVKNHLIKRKKPLSEGFDWFISKTLRPDPSADMKDVSVLQVLTPQQFDVLTADYEGPKLKVYQTYHIAQGDSLGGITSLISSEDNFGLYDDVLFPIAMGEHPNLTYLMLRTI